jgi:hypothetical protein
MQILLNKFQTIQKYLVDKSGDFIVIDTELDRHSKILEYMQECILNKISDWYKNENTDN